MNQEARVLDSRIKPREIVLKGGPESMEGTEWLGTMHKVYHRLQGDRSNVQVRPGLCCPDRTPTDGTESKGAELAEICISLITGGAASAVISAIGSVIAHSKKTRLVVTVEGREVATIEGRGFSDTAHVERVAASMAGAGAELHLRAGDALKTGATRL